MDTKALAVALSGAKGYTDEKIALIGKGMEYKGSVQTVDDLPTPTVDNKSHLYTVLENGHEYVCDGVQWVDLSADLNGVVKTRAITDTEMTVGELKEIVDEINEKGEHVLFDFSSFNDRMYVCLVSIGERALINDLINGIYAEALYDEDMLISDLIEGGKPYIVPNKILTVDAESSLGNQPIGVKIQVYTVVDDSDVLWSEQVYNGEELIFLVPLGARIKVTGEMLYPYVNPETKYFDVDDDIETTISFIEVGGKSTVADIHALIEYGVEEDVLEILDEINITWTATNGTSYTAPARVMDLGQTYKRHSDGQMVKGVCMQFKYGFPDMPAFDREENQVKATEETAQAGVYYYGKSGNNWTFLDLEVGATIPYSDYDDVYVNSFKDTGCNIQRYGNNLLEYSAEHQWLNSAEEKGNWWASTHLGDVEPSQATTIHGFMHGFSNDDLQYILDEDFKVAQNTVTADGSLVTLHGKFRNPMVVEMYGSPQIAGEGDDKYWEGWKELCNNSAINPLSAPGNGNCDARRIKNLENDNFSTAWCSSAHRTHANGAWGSNNSNGNLNNNNANNANRSAPRFVIF